MGYYLVDNKPRSVQYRMPRRSKPSGVIVLHSTESVPDTNPPDTGAENVAGFIRNRSDPGSYHLLCDSDSTIKLIPLAYEAFHDGTGTNPHSIGISGAFRAHQFATLPKSWRDGCIRQMALAARGASGWLQTQYGIEVPPRRISVAQARNRVPGFVTHGMLDPSRRSDPDGTNSGSRFPWSDFFAYYTEADDDMTPEQASQLNAILVEQRALRGEMDRQYGELSSRIDGTVTKTRSTVYTARDSLAALIRKLHGEGE